MLYRSGYGRKPGQEAVLKIKLPHSALARLLDRCDCRRGGGGGAGRVQWDPERDLMQGDGARVWVSASVCIPIVRPVPH